MLVYLAGGMAANAMFVPMAKKQCFVCYYCSVVWQHSCSLMLSILALPDRNVDVHRWRFDWLL